MQPNFINLYGASGHAKVVAEIITLNGMKIGEVFDDNLNVKYFLDHNVKHCYKPTFPIIVSIGDCKIRKKIADRLNQTFATAIHHTAIISPSAVIGVGSVIMAGSVIQTEATIGKHCIVNTQSSVGHECQLDDFVHIASGTTICGNCKIGECTWVGAGSVVKQGIKIGKNCMIGAGSVVVKDIPDDSVAYGNPCRVVSKNK